MQQRPSQQQSSRTSHTSVGSTAPRQARPAAQGELFSTPRRDDAPGERRRGLGDRRARHSRDDSDPGPGDRRVGPDDDAL